MTWKCYHCGEVCETEEEGLLHFGNRWYTEPACQIDVAKYREMEVSVNRCNEEDTDLHREIHRVHSERQTAVTRAEEAGYARGLEDAKKFPADLGLTVDTSNIATPAELRTAVKYLVQQGIIK